MLTVFQYVSQLRAIPESSKTCPSEKIMECWENCKDSKLMQDLADGESVDEKAVQAAFVACVRLILKTLGYCHSLVETSNVIGSAFKPDLILASQGVTKPGFQDVLAVVELKAPTVPLQDAVAQAGKYLNEISGRGNCDFSHLAHSSLVAIGSNYKEICIFGLSKIDPVPILGLYTTAQSELFPKEWKSIQNHTTGFSNLCHAIHQTGNSTSKYITINDCDVVITGTINEQEGVGVYFCTYLNQEFVVKQGYGKRGKGLVDLELAKLKEISKILEFSPYLLPWRPDLYIQYGFAMSCATIISDESFCARVFLEEQYRWLIEGLRILHRNNLFHMDIRPGNIVIYEGTARFIDWFTLQRSELTHAWLRQGHDDPFWPVNRDKFNENGLFHLWDLISLGYTFLFLLVTDQSFRSMMLKDRSHLVNSMSTDSTFIGKIARIIQYLEATNAVPEGDNLYDACLSMLNESEGMDYAE